jgi:cyclophilin family peptidyl-prolyl cis-trans isomerase
LKRLASVPRDMRIALVLLLLSVPVLAGCAENNGAEPTPTTTVTSPTGATPPASGTSPPATGTGANECKAGGPNPTWVMDTSMGEIRITLFCDKTPITAGNIVNLTTSGYYDGTKFHRVIKDFMDQGGDPLTKDDSAVSRWGTGGPGYTITDEFYCADGTVSYTHPASCPTGLGLKHERPGILSMANTGRPKTGGSQFFMTAVATPWLDGKHAVFGEVADADSLDVVLAINNAPTTQPGDRPNPAIVLEKATIEWG